MRGSAEDCDRVGVQFIPQAFESLGGWHKEAEREVKKLVVAMARQSGCDCVPFILYQKPLCLVDNSLQYLSFFINVIFRNQFHTQPLLVALNIFGDCPLSSFTFGQRA